MKSFSKGLTRTIDISPKTSVYREAIASGRIRLKKETIKLIKAGKIEKGDVFHISTIAGINGAKLTPSLVMLCHPVKIEGTEVKVELEEHDLTVSARVVATDKTGVEMEALTAVSVALLNIWDIVKRYEKDRNGQYPTTLIKDIRVLRKVKGKIESPRKT